jgi:DNA segregation ATPase FtsK/SpoIIIE, S-DNA-T family
MVRAGDAEGRMRISLTALTDHGPRDVVVIGDLETTVAGVATSLLATLNEDSGAAGEPLAQVLQHPRARWASGPATRHAPAHAAQALWTGGRLLDPTATASSTLRNGAVVAVDSRDAAGTMLAEPAGSFEIRVSGGPAAGAVHRVGIGTVVLGTDDDVNVKLDDPGVPGRALRVTVEARRVTVESLCGEPVLEGVPVTGVIEWPPGDVIVVGTSVLTLCASTPPDAHLSPLEDGGLAYHRPPRVLPSDEPRQLELPQEPVEGQRQQLRLLVSALLAVAGIVMVIVTAQWYWALTALAYPIIQAGEWISDRLYGRKSFKKALKEFHAKQDRFDGELERLRREDETQRRAAAPDPAEVLLTVTGPRRRLWERRPDDPDKLHLRFGLADLPAHIELFAASQARTPTVHRRAPASQESEPDQVAGRADELIPPIARTIPVRLPLPDLGVVGLSGPRDRSRAVARWLVAQAAALHSPRDLAIVVLSADPDGGEHWNWVRWLPHCAPRQNEECLALVGTDTESVARRVTELAIRITERRRAQSAQGTGGFFPGAAEADPNGRPHDILLVLDGARLLRRVPGMPQVLSKGPEVGLHAICIDDDERLLPEECRAVALWDWDRPTHVRLRGEGLETYGPVLAEQVSTAWCDRLARALAPVRDVSREDVDANLPASVRLLDVLAMPDPAAEHILAAWSTDGRGTVDGRESARGTTRVPIGVAADGVFSVDLRHDGPHVLVTGATGSGKSELLRTLIVSLAVANRPDELTFVLVDCEGGVAFGACVELPHTVGLITNLGGVAADRTLESLDAELRRREEILFAAGVSDLADYCELRDAGDLRAAVRLPRLVVVVDEFAAMAGDMANFVACLLDIGDRGRSLGIHLVLATQHPAGALTTEVRAAANLQIALRLTDSDESAQGAAAARIPKTLAGRCYVGSGATAPRAVQTARVGGGRAGATPPARTLVQQVPWTALGRALPHAVDTDEEATTVTDLAVLVAAIRDAADRVHTGS